MRNLIMLAAFFVGFSAEAETLSLNSFLQKVSKDNSSVESQRLNIEASELRASEGYLLTSPNLFALGNTSVDKKQVQNIAFEGTQRNSKTFQFGVEQQSRFGINHKLFYALDQSELIGVDPSFFSNPAVSRSSLNYEFSLPIWRNSLGRSTRDQVNAIVSQNKSESFTAKFTRKQIKANAVVVYWRLKSAQALYALSSELLESNTKFLKWTKARVRDRLGEGTDLKQAEAAIALREYDLEQARMDLNEAQQLFNEMLEVSPETPVPELEDLPNIDAWPGQLKLTAPQSREDILSLEELLSAQNSQSKIAAETTKPQVDLTGLFSTNGLDSQARESFNKSTTTNNPSYTVGLRLSIPLDRSSVGDVQRSAQLRAQSIDAQIRRKKFEVKAELERLERNYLQAMKVYSTAKAVERAQLAKYNLETERRKSGRTTTFQLLSFQQEYQSAKQALIRAKNTVLQLNAQSILFSDENGASL